jgi:alpha-1,4-digalacturonate transport system substrate-binding protein
VPYKAILESLPVQLAAGSGPDIARVTDLGGLHKYYLDLAPFVDRADWEKNFGDTLDWFRAGPDDKGIYGMMTQLTITGPYINKTLFDQAGVKVPGPKATWDEWAEAAREVAKKTETPFPMAMDRSGHRIAGPAISMGAKIFDAEGNPALVDPGFEKLASMFVKWNQDGTMDKDVWAGKGGAAYADATQEFISGQLVFYYSGSWQVGRFDKAIADAFDWRVVGSPCGPAACTGMPGGAAMVGFKQTKHPAEVAKVIDYFAQEGQYTKLMELTDNVPANKAVASQDIDYQGVSPQAKTALQAWTKQIPTISPIAYKYQGYALNRGMFNATVQRITQAIVGELTMDEAMRRLTADIKEATAAAKK